MDGAWIDSAVRWAEGVQHPLDGLVPGWLEQVMQFLYPIQV
jgi:hypothetical protein